jgi:hypothetical protein
MTFLAVYVIARSVSVSNSPIDGVMFFVVLTFFVILFCSMLGVR